VLFKVPPSPKRIGARRDFDLYHYYAAFAQSFVEQQILELNLPSDSTILDPWCGSGTTLAAARRFGHQSFGFDINLVSVVLSKSRFATTDRRRR
jgi:DNA modification methylase